MDVLINWIDTIAHDEYAVDHEPTFAAFVEEGDDVIAVAGDHDATCLGRELIGFSSVAARDLCEVNGVRSAVVDLRDSQRESGGRT